MALRLEWRGRLLCACVRPVAARKTERGARGNPAPLAAGLSLAMRGQANRAAVARRSAHPG